MSNHAAAPVDHHRLAACPDPAVAGQPLDFGEVDGSSEEPDEVALSIQDWNRDHDRGDAGVSARTDHVRVLGPDPSRIEHVFNVVPHAVVDADARWWRRGDRTSGKVPHVQLQHRRLRGVRRGQLLVQVRGVEAGVVQPGDTGVVL